MNGEAKLLVPFRRLPTPLVRLGLLCLLAQTSGTVWVLLAHRLSVRQVLRSIHDQYKSPNLRPIHRHVREDACGMHSVRTAVAGEFGGHGEMALFRTSEARAVRTNGTV